MSDPRGPDRRTFLAAAGAALGRPFLAAAGGPASGTGASAGRAIVQAARPVPLPAQLVWQRDELALFLHFGINTFTDREWGEGDEDPRLFAPSALGARQWARAARAAGFRALILTAKHHDGFCLWPSRTTAHSVASSPWRSGGGDVVREFVDACRAEGLRAGLYCSPWDRNAPSYGDSPRYNALYREQLSELLTRYGPIHEVWFDGANGEGPNGRRQQYDWPRVWSLVRRLQPNAVMFSDAGPDVRWIGNERGVAGDPNWSTVDPAVAPAPGVAGDAVMRQLQHGDPDGTVWRPGETDVSIRPGWFWHPAEDERVRTAEDLVGLFFTSVGRNSKLLLNVPPTRAGLLHETDVMRLAGMRERLSSLFAADLAAGKAGPWRPTGERSAELEVDLGATFAVNVADLREDIAGGQDVARHALEGWSDGGWRMLAAGSTIGYRRLHRFEPVPVRRLRLRIEDAVARPRPVRLLAYGLAGSMSTTIARHLP
jgi:alpha-L-fucosidase